MKMLLCSWACAGVSPSTCQYEVPGRQAGHDCCSLQEFIFQICQVAVTVHKYTDKKKILVSQPGDP